MYQIHIEDEQYPKLLKEISKPPKTLYCMGDIRLLQAERKVAVVGTRTATDYGKICCQKLVKTLCSADVVTVSWIAPEKISLAEAENSSVRTTSGASWQVPVPFV